MFKAVRTKLSITFFVSLQIVHIVYIITMHTFLVIAILLIGSTSCWGQEEVFSHDKEIVAKALSELAMKLWAKDSQFQQVLANSLNLTHEKLGNWDVSLSSNNVHFSGADTLRYRDVEHERVNDDYVQVNVSFLMNPQITADLRAETVFYDVKTIFDSKLTAPIVDVLEMRLVMRYDIKIPKFTVDKEQSAISTRHPEAANKVQRVRLSSPTLDRLGLYQVVDALNVILDEKQMDWGFVVFFKLLDVINSVWGLSSRNCNFDEY